MFLNSYREQTEDNVDIATYLSFTEFMRDMMPVQPNDAEFNYEKDQTKKNYPEEWDRYRQMEKEKDAFFAGRKINGVL